MRKILSIICFFRAVALSLWYNENTEGCLLDEYAEGHYRCKICGNEAVAYSKSEKHHLKKVK